MLFVIKVPLFLQVIYYICVTDKHLLQGALSKSEELPVISRLSTVYDKAGENWEETDLLV